MTKFMEIIRFLRIYFVAVSKNQELFTILSYGEPQNNRVKWSPGERY